MRCKFIAVLILTILVLSFHGTSHAASLEVKQNDVVLTGTDGIKSTNGAYVTIPPGGIIMWSGPISTIPAGWALCDGSNGTPNLTDRFVIHADADTGGARNVGETGGSNEHSHTGGAHTHEMPVHNHKVYDYVGSSSNAKIYNSAGTLNSLGYAAKLSGTGFLDTSGRAHKINEDMYTSNVDPGDTHSGGAVATSTESNLPKFYALAYIMKL